MIALILNSGKGNRMGELTRLRPKCLVEISKGMTILSLQISLLILCGIRKLVITTGPNPHLIEDYVRVNFPGLDVTYVHNAKYETTNYIYSMHCAAGLIGEDCLLLHGDIVTERGVCERLIASEAESAVIVSEPPVLPEKDFKARIENGIVREIGVSLRAHDLVFLLPFYKLSNKSMGIWLNEIAAFVANGNTGVYAEEAFNRISETIGLSPLFIGEDELCMEIDDKHDLERARKLLKTSE